MGGLRRDNSTDRGGLWKRLFDGCVKGLHGSGFPQLQGSVIAGRSDSAAVMAELVLPDPSRMPPENEQGLSAQRIPEPDGLVPTRRGEPAVGAESDAIDVFEMSLENALSRAGGGIPQPHGTIAGPRGHKFAISADGDRVDRPGMIPKYAAEPMTGKIPEYARAVRARRSKRSTVGAEGQIVDRIGVAAEDIPDSPGQGVHTPGSSGRVRWKGESGRRD